MHIFYVPFMKSKRAHVLLPQDLVRESMPSSAPRPQRVLVETAARQVRRRKAIAIPRNRCARWEEADQPGPETGLGAWIRQTPATRMNAAFLRGLNAQS